MITIEPATMEHARTIELRPGDAREIAALGMAKEEAVRASLASAVWADAYLADGDPSTGSGQEVAAIVGLSVGSLLGGVGVPWLLTGLPVDRHRKEFLAHTRAGVARMRAEFPVLANIVHAEYPQAIRWLRWLGFAIGAPHPVPPFGAPFCRFEMRASSGAERRTA